jgi:hypothetical protein
MERGGAESVTDRAEPLSTLDFAIELAVNDRNKASIPRPPPSGFCPWVLVNIEDVVAGFVTDGQTWASVYKFQMSLRLRPFGGSGTITGLWMFCGDRVVRSKSL